MGEYIFICYTHQNNRFARKLAQQLRQQGLSVWLDQWELADDTDWDKTIRRAIVECHYFVMVFSPAAVSSWLVRDQYRLAGQADKKMVLVQRHPCDLPPDLQNIPCFDFTGRNHRQRWRQMGAYLTNRPAPPDLSTRLAWAAELMQSWFSGLLPLLWPGWLGPLLLVVCVGVGLLLWPRGGSATFADPPQTERLAVVALPSLTPDVLSTPVLSRVRVRDGKVMVYVPSGEFMMGSVAGDPLADEDEFPNHPIYLTAFWIDRTEIANIQYQLCVADGVCSLARTQGRRFEGDYQPVVGVDWFQAEAYCRWAGGRLPTEAEWEKAARGVDGRRYPWGNDFEGSRLNFCDQNCIADWRDFEADDGYPYTAPVGSYADGASPYGALDMSGNVWEWTADWYAADYYSRSPYDDPPGPTTGQQRVIRGGSWLYYGKNLRAAKRHKDLPSYRYDNIGFRCVVVE